MWDPELVVTVLQLRLQTFLKLPSITFWWPIVRITRNVIGILCVPTFKHKLLFKSPWINLNLDSRTMLWTNSSPFQKRIVRPNAFVTRLKFLDNKTIDDWSVKHCKAWHIDRMKNPKVCWHFPSPPVLTREESPRHSRNRKIECWENSNWWKQFPGYQKVFGAFLSTSFASRLNQKSEPVPPKQQSKGNSLPGFCSLIPSQTFFGRHLNPSFGEVMFRSPVLSCCFSLRHKITLTPFRDQMLCVCCVAQLN